LPYAFAISGKENTQSDFDLHVAYVSAKGRPRPEAPQANHPDIIASSIFIWLFGHITFATNLLVSI
jgi:hypothetical protein